MNSSGKNYYIPSNITYKEWKQTYVNKNNTRQTSLTDYLVRSHIPGENITSERILVNKVIASMPFKVQEAIHRGTIIDIGKKGASQYDYNNDILYIAKNFQKEDIIHEIGHLVENKILGKEIVENLKKEILSTAFLGDITTETYYDADGNPRDIFILKSEKFVSEYQGRLYIDEFSELLDEDCNIKGDKLWEFISEPFREYIENPNNLKENYKEFYSLFKEGLK